uniref:30S ribosomal protein S31 n=1 Tax=Gongylonema pulchrum TaxID=637853 RepID=A0A183D2U9_9BILA
LRWMRFRGRIVSGQEKARKQREGDEAAKKAGRPRKSSRGS